MSRVDVRITVEGPVGAFESLRDWLHHEPDLRGKVQAASAPPCEGALGIPIELVVVLATSASTTAAVLAQAVSRWLIERERQRRADVTVTVTRPDGDRVSVSVKRASESEQILRAALEAASPGPSLLPDPPGPRHGC